MLFQEAHPNQNTPTGRAKILFLFLLKTERFITYNGKNCLLMLLNGRRHHQTIRRYNERIWFKKHDEPETILGNTVEPQNQLKNIKITLVISNYNVTNF